MIWHPLVWAFGAAALTGGVLYFFASFHSMDVAVNWDPGRSDKDQLVREHRAEVSSLLARGALCCLFTAALIGVAGVALCWHRIVPGAMCGTGVLQAMGLAGSRTILFWGLTLLLLYGWHVVDCLDRQSPQGVLVQKNARLLLTVSPFFILALIYSQKAFFAVDTAAAVSCCAAVYDKVFDSAIDIRIKPAIRLAAFWGSFLGSIVVAGFAVRGFRLRNRKQDRITAYFAMVWVAPSAIAVKQIWSSYYYQVLAHPCPWCLFLPDYYGAGFLIFGCLAVVLLEGTALGAACRVYRQYPNLSAHAQRRCQQANSRIFDAVIGYTVLTLFPAIHWRLSTGVWMNGNHFFN
jgi:hypothetical protein